MSPSSLDIRLAREADDAVLGDLQVAAYTAQYSRLLPHFMPSPQRLAALRDQANRRLAGTVLVGERGGAVVGTVTLYPWGRPQSEAWIAGAADLRLLAIDPACHGQGLSQALMAAAEDLAWQWKAPAVCLHVRRGCDGVARLYQARGYVRDAAGDFSPMPGVELEGYVLSGL